MAAESRAAKVTYYKEFTSILFVCTVDKDNHLFRSEGRTCIRADRQPSLICCPHHLLIDDESSGKFRV